MTRHFPHRGESTFGLVNNSASLSSPLRGEVAPEAPERAGEGDVAEYTRDLELHLT